MQNQAIDENEAHKDISDELEDMDDEGDSAKTLKTRGVTYKLEVRSQELDYNGS